MAEKDKIIEEACTKVWEVHSALTGLASLLEGQGVEASHGPEELFGVGQVLRKLAEVLEQVEDNLRA